MIESKPQYKVHDVDYTLTLNGSKFLIVFYVQRHIKKIIYLTKDVVLK